MEAYTDPTGVPMIRGTLKVVPIGQLKPNPWNTNEQSEFIEGKLALSLKEFGFTTPILVRSGSPEKKSFGFYEIIAGEHRWKQAKALNMKEVPINDLGILSDAATKKLMIVDNNTRGRDDQDALSKVLRELNAEGVDLEVMPYDPAELDGLINSQDFEFEDPTTPSEDAEDSEGGDGPQENLITIPGVIGYNDITEELDTALGQRLDRIVVDAKIPRQRPWEVLILLMDCWDRSGKPTQSDFESELPPPPTKTPKGKLSK